MVDKIDKNNNRIIGEVGNQEHCIINFYGKNNICYIDSKANIADVDINFYGDNSIVFLSENKHRTRAYIDIYNDSVFYLGKNANTTRPIHVIMSERKHVFIGNDCLFSRDIWFRNGDPHLIYDAKSKKRINVSKSIFLGDHVWVAQNVLISKGTRVGSGSIIGGWSMTGGKLIESNTAWGGCPCKRIKKNVFWRKPSCHGYTSAETKQTSIYNKKKFIYTYGKATISFREIEKHFDNLCLAEDKMNYILETIYNNNHHNRFYVGNNRCISIIIRKLKDYKRKYLIK